MGGMHAWVAHMRGWQFQAYLGCLRFRFSPFRFVGLPCSDGHHSIPVQRIKWVSLSVLFIQYAVRHAKRVSFYAIIVLTIQDLHEFNASISQHAVRYQRYQTRVDR